MINKLITLESKPGHEKDLSELVKTLIDPSRKENGCVKYDAYGDVLNPTLIYIVEQWETEESLNAHKRTAHFTNFKTVAPALLKEKSSTSLQEL